MPSEYANWLANYRFPHAKVPRGPGRKNGRSTKERRLNLLLQLWHNFNGTQFEGVKFAKCHYCQIVFRLFDLTIDHVIPRSRGGKSNMRNYVLACEPCNGKKANSLPDESWQPASPRAKQDAA